MCIREENQAVLVSLHGLTSGGDETELRMPKSVMSKSVLIRRLNLWWGAQVIISLIAIGAIARIMNPEFLGFRPDEAILGGSRIWFVNVVNITLSLSWVTAASGIVMLLLSLGILRDRRWSFHAYLISEVLLTAFALYFTVGYWRAVARLFETVGDANAVPFLYAISPAVSSVLNFGLLLYIAILLVRSYARPSHITGNSQSAR
jgi:hypothetical protein